MSLSQLLALPAMQMGLLAEVNNNTGASTFQQIEMPESSWKVIHGDTMLRDGHRAYGGRSGESLTPEERAQARWFLFMKEGTTDAEVDRLCDLSACEYDGFSKSRGGIRYIEVRSSEEDMTKTVEAADGKVGFVEPGNMGTCATAEPINFKGQMLKGRRNQTVINGTTPEPTRPPPNMFTPTFVISSGLVVAIFVFIVFNAVKRVIYDTDGTFTVHYWWYPLAVTALLVSNTLYLLEAVIKPENTEEMEDSLLAPSHAARSEMILAVLWFLCTLVYEIHVKKVDWCKDRTEIQQVTIYGDLTMSLFKVTSTFLLQSSLCCLLILVATSNVNEKLPEGQSQNRTILNTVVSVIIQMYLFIRMKVGGTWEEVLRLRDTVAAEVPHAQEGVEDQYFKLGKGDWYLRLMMSILLKGIFHKYMILVYPLYVFPTESAIDLVKDAFAITFVTELDDCAPVYFRVLIESYEAIMEEMARKVHEKLASQVIAEMTEVEMQAVAKDQGP